ncbi:ribosomal protein L7/L12 [Streptomyces sp. NPDC001890]|uniref:ribosomal protein L7/L12 n=1 Tax=Streptomyces sp. NPDC001890 TaxID=3364620 RepID=UPI0036AD35C4
MPTRVIAGRYRLLATLGSGGMGRVWRAHDQQLGVDVAVKEVFRRPGIPDSHWEELLIRARREARHGARLRDHANIVAVHDVVIEDGIPWTVMRLVKGVSLESRLSKGRLTVEDTTKVAAAVLGALGAAHAAGIIHRDVKPANIMLGDDGGVLLTDFGIAINEVDTKLTQDGGIIGSMAYIAPERADGEEGSEASDLFSLGATLYQATEGKSPFQRDTLTGTLRAVAIHEPPPPANAGHLAPLITALLRKEPGDRPTVATALAMTTPGARTPEIIQDPARAEREVEPRYDVILLDVGESEVPVIRVLHRLTSLSVKEAMLLVSRAPQKVLTKVDWRTAADAEDALVNAGARAVFKRHERHTASTESTEQQPPATPTLTRTARMPRSPAVVAPRGRPEPTKANRKSAGKQFARGGAGLVAVAAIVAIAALLPEQQHTADAACATWRSAMEQKNEWTYSHPVGSFSQADLAAREDRLVSMEQKAATQTSDQKLKTALQQAAADHIGLAAAYRARHAGVNNTGYDHYSPAASRDDVRIQEICNNQ